MKYKIKQGKHYHSNLTMRVVDALRLCNKDYIGYHVMLESNCWYPSSVVQNSGYNKLFGAGKMNHQEDSARFVWQPDFDNVGRIKIFSYVYQDGIWTAKYLFTSSVGQWYALSIYLYYDPLSYVFSYVDNEYIVEHNDPVLRKVLQPYFGGQDTAYKDMVIHLV